MTRRDDEAPARTAFIVTCEHGGNRIPAAYASRFAGCETLLESHLGYDPGALGVARDLAHALRAPLVVATVSRLLVELNRSPGRQFRFSPVMREAPPPLREEVCRCHYTPYRQKVETLIARNVAAGAHVVHISSHSFTPVLDGVVRRGDVGILYDPARTHECALASRWQRALQARRTQWIVRRNYPYRGTSDGFTTYLRKRYGDDVYSGLELEVNQKRVHDDELPAEDRAAIVAALCDALSFATASDARRRMPSSATTRASPPARRSAASCRYGSRG